MAYSAKVILKTKSPYSDKIITTLEVTLPRIVLAEFNTHRTFSRNSASSRAIPVEKQIAKVLSDPFVPEYWGKNQKGMQAEQEIDQQGQLAARELWLQARDTAVKHAQDLLKIGIHKQLTNRLLEPFMWQTILVTATEWDNFYALRRSKDAQPEIKKAADMMFETQRDAAVQERDQHLPLVTTFDEQELTKEFLTKKLETKLFNNSLMHTLMMISSGRCARVSYLTHTGLREPRADIDLAERLLSAGHMSPFEHAAVWSSDPEYLLSTVGSNVRVNSNFTDGWVQFRKFIVNEHSYALQVHI